MKFSLKLLLWTMIVMAIALGFSGFYFINYVFETSLEREAGQALDENSILSFAFETAVLNVPAKYDVLQDSTVEQIAYNLENSGQNTSRMLRLSNEEKKTLYVSDGFDTDDGLLLETVQGTKTYRTIAMNGHYYIQTGSTVNAFDRVLYLETLRDVSVVFNERELGFRVYRQVTVLMLLFGTIIMHLIASWLTKPIRLLTRATKRMAAGDYDYRAKLVSDDELGQLTRDFNKMAEALEENMNELEAEIQAREDFVGAFAHELKTPLQSILGSAELLKSGMVKQDDIPHFSGLIHTEAARLVTLVEDIIHLSQLDEGMVLPQESVGLFEVAKNVTDTLSDTAAQKCVNVLVSGENICINGVRSFLYEMIFNLCDNAIKYNVEGGTVKIVVSNNVKGASITVKDTGIGIPPEYQSMVFERFFRVDKSRSKASGGTGLGLSIVKHGAQYHGAKISLRSQPKKGTEISILFPAK